MSGSIFVRNVAQAIGKLRPWAVPHGVLLDLRGGSGDLVVGEVEVINGGDFLMQRFEGDAQWFRGEDAEEEVSCAVIEWILRAQKV